MFLLVGSDVLNIISMNFRHIRVRWPLFPYFMLSIKTYVLWKGMNKV
jgi:hypothetical protein